MTILNGLYNAQRSMMINQAALNLVSNNISNVNTEGYSKQRIEMSAYSNTKTGADLSAQASSGLGAIITDISRNRDVFLDKYYRNESTKLASLNDLSSLTSLVEDITDELDNTGLMNSLNSFYQAAQNMSLNPTDSVVKTAFSQSAQDVANTFNHTSQQLTDLRNLLVGDPTHADSLKTSKIYMYSNDLNDKLAQMAKLNESISMVNSSGAIPNALLDQRDLLLDQIAEYVPIDTKESTDGLVNISIGGVEVVKGAEQTGKIVAVSNDDNNPALVQIVNSKDETNIKVSDLQTVAKSGKIAAVLEMAGNQDNKLTIKNVLNQLDLLASNFAQEVNAIQLAQVAGTPADPGPPVVAAVPSKASMCLSESNPPVLIRATQNIFLDANNSNTSITGVTAANIHVNQDIIDHPSGIATGIVETIDEFALPLASRTWAPADNAQVGNNLSALDFSKLRDKNISGLNGSTTDNFITSLIGNIGIKAEATKTALETQVKVVDQVSIKRESSSGVNLDEELVDLTKYQRSYEASARLFNTTNEILKTIMALGA